MDKKNGQITIKEMAKLCGVSTATVSRVVNGTGTGYSRQTEQKVLDIAKNYSFTLNPLAQSLVTSKTHLIGLLVPDIHYEFFQDFFSGLEESLGKKNYRLLLCNTNADQKREDQYIRSLCNGLVDGIVISTLNMQENNDLIFEIREKNIPVILLERYGSEVEGITSIRLDNYRAAYMAVEHLIAKGHKRIAFLNGAKNAANAKKRYEGYLGALKAYGIRSNEKLTRFAGYNYNESIEATKDLLKKEKFTALVAANDQMAVGACRAITESGKNVPEDISVMAIDGTTNTDIHQPSISSIRFCGKNWGELAGEKMLEMLNNNNRNIVGIEGIDLELWEGSSVKEVL